MSPTRAPIDPTLTPRQLIELHCKDILSSPGMVVESQCIQHGTTSVLEHSISVTALTLAVATKLRIPVDQRVLARGALLHDYFLYDWHDPDPWHKVHGFRHPFIACKNAVRDFGVTPHEQAMIRTHMFPLVPIPPVSREAALLCLVDKIVATKETIDGFRQRIAK